MKISTRDLKKLVAAVKGINVKVPRYSIADVVAAKRGGVSPRRLAGMRRQRVNVIGLTPEGQPGLWNARSGHYVATSPAPNLCDDPLCDEPGCIRTLAEHGYKRKRTVKKNCSVCELPITKPNTVDDIYSVCETCPKCNGRMCSHIVCGHCGFDTSYP